MVRSSLSRMLGLFSLGFFLFAAGPTQAQNKKKEDNNESWDVRATKMSTKDKLSLVGKVVKEARTIHNELVEKLKNARNKKDLVSVDCLGEKFSRVQALMFLMEQKRSNFLKAVANNKTTEGNSYFANLMQSHGQLKNLGVAASQCRGRTGTYTGNTVVDFDVPPRISSTDPTLPPWKEPVIYRPANASNPY